MDEEEPVAEELSTERLLEMLPRQEPRSKGAIFWICLFCLGCLVAVVWMPVNLLGLLTGGLLLLGSIIFYLLIRSVLKRSGMLSMGVFTLDPQGTFRAISGVSAARRQAKALENQRRWVIREWLVGAAFALVVIGAPATIAVAFDFPEIMLGFMVCAGLVMAEMPVLVLRQVRAEKDGAETLDGELSMSLAASYVSRGADAERLKNGVPVTDVVPTDPDEQNRVIEHALMLVAHRKATAGYTGAG